MGPRILRGCVGLVLAGSGALMYAAAWERWADVCSWGSDMTEACGRRANHLFDFLPPLDPWQPVGDAAQLAGSSLLVLALALPVLPWALTGHRPGRFSAGSLVLTELALVAVGVATLRSGISGDVVLPPFPSLVLPLWMWVPPFLFGWLAVIARGWARAAAVVLVLATPLVASFTYALGPWDAKPWWEAISGALSGIAGLCLLVAAVWLRAPAGQDAAPTAVALSTHGSSGLSYG